MRKSELALGAFLVMLVCGASVLVFALHAPGSLLRQMPTSISSSTFSATGLDRNMSRSPTDTKLIENAINGMLQGLDPHSSYLTPKEFQDMQVQTRGEFGGWAWKITMEDGVVKVIAPIDNTRIIHHVGICIDHLDGKSIQGLTLKDIEKMRGRSIRRLRSPSSGRAFHSNPNEGCARYHSYQSHQI